MDALDIIEIHQLLGRYGHSIDARDWAAFAALFEADAVLDYTEVRAPHVLHGIEEIVAWFRDANHPSAHHVTNIVVDEVDVVVVVVVGPPSWKCACTASSSRHTRGSRIHRSDGSAGTTTTWWRGAPMDGGAS
mgnify:CR=1 FL=1